MASNTTVIFIPGAWHKAAAFTQVAQALEKQGYKTQLLDLPSVGPKEHLKNLDPDVQTIKAAIQQAVDKGQKVTLVGHSYGGIPMTQSVQGFEYADRQKSGQQGGVAQIVYCCSFVISEGQSLIGAFGGNDLPWFNISEDRLEVNPDTPQHIFYNDMSDEAAAAAIKNLHPFSYQTMHSPISYAAWKHVPSTYIYCLKDNAIPIDIQKMMVEGTAKDYNFNTETIDASHSPMFSKPQETADAIQRAIEK